MQEAWKLRIIMSKTQQGETKKKIRKEEMLDEEDTFKQVIYALW